VRAIADLHLHSRYAMATSKNLDLERLAAGARTKGIDLLGTGDFTHPLWLRELRSKLEPLDGTGLYSFGGVTWMLSSEVSTVYEQGGRTRKVHHLLYAPDFEVVAQANEFLGKHANLGSDGRPVLTGINSAELVEGLTSLSQSLFVIPAHAWTPWFSVFGSKSGFNSLKECFQDQTKKIFAIETGLSRDPAMNWRLSALDQVALMSNSDAHSANPWRIGREANVFNLESLTYRGVFDSVKEKDPHRFLFTVEVDPSYGKYHYTGHRKCGVSLSPQEAERVGDRCPKCGKKLTIGVLERVDELADRPEGFVPRGAVPFRKLLPLYEVISYATGVNRLYVKRVIEEQDRLIRAFKNEFAVLLDAGQDELARVTTKRVSGAILSAREGSVTFTPGYDGVYGIPSFGSP
jgi:uncharacterized protein (TIGR00375 family)